MLHILWMLIKLILILLGTVLGLAVLVLLLLLFCPVRYSAEALKETSSFKETEAAVRVSWLFGGISFTFRRIQGKNTQKLCVFGIPVLSLLQKRKQKKKPDIPYGSAEAKQKKDPETGTSDLSESDEKIRTENKNKISALPDKLKEIMDRLAQLPSMLSKIPLTIRRIYDKIDWYRQFFEYPRTKEAVSLVLDRSKKLMHHIFPKKIKGKVTFGSEDPSITGTALAVLGMTMPFHKNRVEVVPVFDNQNILEGNIKIKGRIYGFVPVKILVELYFNKNIKYIISRWKHKEV
ncbi:DUF2953 domain-containing protein [Blautia sp. CAG:257]|uniref:DUF2953 domain-containing protein n=1 Tax=Blautia sp. CAG:257 TaxID=1262756 RepID=UPI0003396FEE|nr:DUF2953 domain-containing protein [Blautia sp. CAG:257]CDA06827.1 putative uncharacterized protein [Blautia sp. CAG:257]